MIFEYGAVSSKFSCEADNKLTAYAAMILHFDNMNHLIVIYSPEECKADQWVNPFGKVSEKLHQIFGGKPEDYPQNDAFEIYFEEHEGEILSCYETIKRIV